MKHKRYLGWHGFFGMRQWRSKVDGMEALQVLWVLWGLSQRHRDVVLATHPHGQLLCQGGEVMCGARLMPPSRPPSLHQWGGVVFSVAPITHCSLGASADSSAGTPYCVFIRGEWSDEAKE